MTSIMVDWTHDILGTEKNHFKTIPLSIYTKDGHSMEMEARMTFQIDDCSIIIKRFGSFETFIEKKLDTLIENFFRYKERQDIMLNRLTVQKELLELLQENLEEYNVRKIDLIIVSIIIPGYGIPLSKKSKKEKSIDEIHHFENKIVDNEHEEIYKILKAMFSLLTVLCILVSVIIIIMNLDHNNPFRLSTMVAIVVVIIGIRQYFDIRKRINTVK